MALREPAFARSPHRPMDNVARYTIYALSFMVSALTQTWPADVEMGVMAKLVNPQQQVFSPINHGGHFNSTPPPSNRIPRAVEVDAIRTAAAGNMQHVEPRYTFCGSIRAT